jgi:hypothetical protein
MLNINYLHFQHIYQSVTANRPFCPLFGPKNRSFHPKYSLFIQFSQPLSTNRARTQTLFQNLESAPSNRVLKTPNALALRSLQFLAAQALRCVLLVANSHGRL